jgi:Flp pilus assembly protein TadG
MSKKNILNQRGAIFMELCVVLPIILMILLFISQIGLLLNEWNVISFAAREGARYGAITHSEANAISRSESLIKSNKGLEQDEFLNKQKYTIIAKKESGNMTVTINYKTDSKLRFFVGIENGKIIVEDIFPNLSSTKTFRLGSKKN